MLPSYTVEPDYCALFATVQADRADESARLVLADWVQDHGDEAEAVAIRGHVSLTVDLLPNLMRCAVALVGACSALLSAYESTMPGAGWTAVSDSLAETLKGMVSDIDRLENHVLKKAAPITGRK